MTTSGYAPADGLAVYYEVHGEGRPLVLLHGGALTIDLSFADLLPSLARRYRVIAIELQGHGRTRDRSSDEPMSFSRFAADVVAVLDHLSVDRADVFGFSLGGLVGLYLALEYPDRVNRLVAAAAHYHSSGYHEEITDPAGTSDLLPTAQDFADMVEAYRAASPEPDHFDEFMGRLNVLVHSWPGLSTEELGRITAPTLLVIGDRDFVKVEHADSMRHLIPDARLAVLPGTKHMEVVRRAEYVLPMTEAFLGANPTPAE
ncbi:pimeloyl-ACP methyl ester carboxylesterase [Crossiella equi]|uniref:Pimeloyl-ACP methyl ester carboxylesterase n=1 Tax=Crossiella equi TaxID=130796 RepID=A0ABS5A765_9PSEU|nr:alpha/beta hydrolase [Crossiella equi]MBP2472432.1 pimeloyl-ACP methyl ester carboxylesterase [Crossiella equi]